MRERLNGRHRAGTPRSLGLAVAAWCCAMLAGCAVGTAAPSPPPDRGTVIETVPTPPSSGPSSASPTTQPPAFDGTVIDVVIAAGKVVASDERLIVALGTVVRMIVDSDIADELHVHGVDEYVELRAGQTVTHDFTANVPGTFEVELHDSGELLFTLQIQP